MIPSPKWEQTPAQSVNRIQSPIQKRQPFRISGLPSFGSNFKFDSRRNFRSLIRFISNVFTLWYQLKVIQHDDDVDFYCSFPFQSLSKDSSGSAPFPSESGRCLLHELRNCEEFFLLEFTTTKWLPRLSRRIYGSLCPEEGHE